MAKTLNHYSQQIKSLAPDVLALQQARQLGDLLIDAKAAVKSAGRKWGEWLEQDCALSSRTAQRFMNIAKRWNDAAFAAARQERPDLPLREADKVLAASSARKRPEPEQPDPYSIGMDRLACARRELTLAAENFQVDQWIGAELQAAQEALAAAFKALMEKRWPGSAAVCKSSIEPRPRRVELEVGDRCSCHAPHGQISGTIVEVLSEPGDWSIYSWLQDGATDPVMVGWGMPGAHSGLRHSIASCS